MQFIQKLFKFKTINRLSKCSRSIYSFNHFKVTENVVLKSTVNKSLNFEFLKKISNYSTVTEHELVDAITYEKVCEETLDSLTEFFEELLDNCTTLESSDVSYSSGVLTVNCGKSFGTYVINRQSPNRQIWLSSPTSGPKRYDYIKDSDIWLYKHDRKTLHQLLQDELSVILKIDVDLSHCLHGGEINLK